MASRLIGKLMSVSGSLLPKLSFAYTGVDLDLNYSNVTTVSVQDSYKQTCTMLTCSFFWEEPLEMIPSMTVKFWQVQWDVLTLSAVPAQKNLYTIVAVPKGASQNCSTPLSNSSVVVTAVRGTPAPGRFTATKFSPAPRGDTLTNLIMRVNRSNFEDNVDKPYNAPFCYIAHDGVICKSWKSLASSSQKLELNTPMQCSYKVLVQEGFNAFASQFAPHHWRVSDYLQQLFSGFVRMESNFPLAFLGAYQFESVSPMLNSLGRLVVVKQEYKQDGSTSLPFNFTLGVLRQ